MPLEILKLTLFLCAVPFIFILAYCNLAKSRKELS